MRGVSKNIVNLKRYVPDLINTLPEMKASYESQEKELQLLKEQIQDIKNQFQIDTATWGLDWWEDWYGIEINHELSYESRRAVLRAKRRGKGTTTPKRIEMVAEAFSNGICDVILHNEEYYFIIKFISTIGVPPRINDLENAINEIKPAHLGVTYEFTYNTYDDVKNHKWTNDELKSYTYEGIRTSKDIKAKGV